MPRTARKSKVRYRCKNLLLLSGAAVAGLHAVTLQSRDPRIIFAYIFLSGALAYFADPPNRAGKGA